MLTLGYVFWAVLAVLIASLTHQLSPAELNDLTIVNGVLCHLASPTKSGGVVSEGEISSLPSRDPLVGADCSVRYPNDRDHD